MPENSSKLQTCTHSETPASLAVISPKSQTVYLSVHPPHMMLYWKLGKTTPVARLDGHNSSVSAVVIGEDERVVVSGSEAGTVMVWDMAVQRAVGSLKGSRSAVTSIAMGKDEKEGLLAVASADGIVRLWDRRTKETTATVVTTHSGCATAVDISPHGDLLSSGSANGVIALWDIGMQRTIHELDLGGVSPHILMFEPRQEHIVCAGVNRQVTVWSLDTYEQTFETRLSGLIHSLTFTSSSRHFFLSTATEIQAIHTKGWESLGCIEGGLSDILVTRAGPNALVTLTATDTGLDVWSTEVTAISSPDSAPSPCSFPTVSLVPTADEQSQALLEVTGNHAVYMDLLTKKKENLSTVSQWWTDANVNATIGSLAMLKDVGGGIEYADVVLDYLDPNRELIHHRLYRDNCLFVQGVYIKDLRVLVGRDLAQVVIVDNAAYSFAYQLSNGVPIITWRDDKSDRELLSLIDYLKKLSPVEDVRPINSSTFSLSTFYDDYISEFMGSPKASKYPSPRYARS